MPKAAEIDNNVVEEEDDKMSDSSERTESDTSEIDTDIDDDDHNIDQNDEEMSNVESDSDSFVSDASSYSSSESDEEVPAQIPHPRVIRDEDVIAAAQALRRRGGFRTFLSILKRYILRDRFGRFVKNPNVVCIPRILKCLRKTELQRLEECGGVKVPLIFSLSDHPVASRTRSNTHKITYLESIDINSKSK